jgi:hypothetical protein
VPPRSPGRCRASCGFRVPGRLAEPLEDVPTGYRGGTDRTTRSDSSSEAPLQPVTLRHRPPAHARGGLPLPPAARPGTRVERNAPLRDLQDPVRRIRAVELTNESNAEPRPNVRDSKRRVGGGWLDQANRRHTRPPHATCPRPAWRFKSSQPHEVFERGHRLRANRVWWRDVERLVTILGSPARGLARSPVRAENRT